MKKANRFYSNKQEKKIAKELGMRQTANSGATLFDKGDVVDENLLIEAKTLTKAQKTHTIKKEWFTKMREEEIATGKLMSVVAFDFGDGENYYALREQDFKQLLELWRREIE